MPQETTDRVLGRVEAKLESLSKELTTFNRDVKSKVDKHDDEIVKLKVALGRYAGAAVVIGMLGGYLIDKVGL